MGTWQWEDGLNNRKSLRFSETKDIAPAGPFLVTSEQVSDFVHGPRNSRGWVPLELSRSEQRGVLSSYTGKAAVPAPAPVTAPSLHWPYFQDPCLVTRLVTRSVTRSVTRLAVLLLVARTVRPRDCPHDTGFTFHLYKPVRSIC